MASPPSPVILHSVVKNYEWGRTGSDCLIASLVHDQDRDRAYDHYAELWLGTHPSGQCTLVDANITLGDAISRGIVGRDDVSSPSVRSRFPSMSTSLPFLLKILNIQKPLSIQAHPNKKLAEQLHRTNPKNYPDPNHKPEMTVALTHFEMLCGFRPYASVYNDCITNPVLKRTLPRDAVEMMVTSPAQGLKLTFSHVMEHFTNDIVNSLVQHLKSLPESERSIDDNVCLRLNSEFPGDVGVVAPYFIQYHTLSRDHAIFIPPDTPHAYISGDCIEIMGCSDNVVRAGLTPKFRDVYVLCDMCVYEEVPYMTVSPTYTENQRIMTYRPPQEFSEFQLIMARLESSGSVVLEHSGSLRLGLVIGGSGSVSTRNGAVDVRRGTTFMTYAGDDVTLSTVHGITVIFGEVRHD